MGDPLVQSRNSAIWRSLAVLATGVAVAIWLSLPSVAQEIVPVGRFAQLALDCVHREYPNKISHVLASDNDVRPPRELTPAFYGCFDWHSAVHGHWLLTRLARFYPDAGFAGRGLSGLTDWHGCCSWPRNCVNGMTQKPDGGN